MYRHLYKLLGQFKFRKEKKNLNNLSLKVALQRLAALHKAHFVKQINRDMASFEERRLHDVLIRRAQAPSQSLQMLPGDFQEIWDQRLLELLEKRRQYLQVCITLADCSHV